MKVPSAIIILLLLAATAVSGLDIERDTLSNGLVVLTVEARKIPLVTCRLLVRAGSTLDPQGREGLANLTAELLMRGAADRTSDEIAETIEATGGELSSFCDEDYAGLNGRALSRDIDLLTSIMADCALRPRFAASEIAGVKREIVSAIRSDSDDPGNAGLTEFRRLVAGDNPLNHLPYGFDSVVPVLTGEDVAFFYDAYYRPNNAFLVCVGDFQRRDLLSILEEKFGGWPRKAIDREPVRPPVYPERPRGRIIKRDITQAYIFLGFPSIGYGAPDWLATRVMNNILGGSGLTSRISDEIREKKGLAYAAYSYFYRFNDAGYFLAEVQTKKESAGEAVGTLIGVIKGIREGAVKKELDDAIDFYVGHFPLTYDTYQELVSLAAQIEIENLGLDYLSRFTGDVARVTLDEVNATAGKYLYPDLFTIVIVGDVDPADIGIEGIDWVE